MNSSDWAGRNTELYFLFFFIKCIHFKYEKYYIKAIFFVSFNIIAILILELFKKLK